MKLNFTIKGFLFLLIVVAQGYGAFSQSFTTVTFTATCTDAATISWTGTGLAASGASDLVFVSSTGVVTYGTPTANISAYTANTTFGSGTAWEGDANAHCVYKGGGTSVNITGLTPGTTYYVLIIDAKNTTYNANNNSASGASFSTPPNPTGFTTPTTGTGQVTTSTWTNPTCSDEVMIIASTASVTTAPSGNGSAYTADASNKYGATGTGTNTTGAEYVVYKGTGTSATITALTNGLTYYFKIFTRKGTTWSSGVEVNATLPPSNVTGASFTATCIDAGTVNWTNPGTVYNIIVFAKQGSSINVGSPTANVSTYTANTAFTSGTPYENDGSAYCVYKGTSNSVAITGLTAGATYYFAAFNVNGTNYSSATTANNPTPSTPNNATGFTPTAGNGQVSLSWTSPTGCSDEVMIVASQSGSITTTPSGNGSTYTPVSATFGSGYATVASTEYVVYKGTGTSVVVTGLTNCTQADFKIFTRKGSTWSSGTATSATPISPLSVSSLSPIDGAINVATNTKLTITFNQNVSISATATGVTAEKSIVVTKDPFGSPSTQTIDRSLVSITGNVATITINTLSLGTVYRVVVGNKVLSGCGVDFSGITAGNWDFTASTGVAVTAPSVTLCQNVYGPLGSIVLNETAVNNIQGTASTTKNLILKFDASGFAFKAGTAGVSVSTPNGDDITSATASSISFSSATFNFTFPAGSAIDGLDQISINGLQVISDGSNPTGNIIVDPASTLTIQGLTTGTTILGTVNSGSTPPAAPTAPTITGGGYNFCQGTNISAISASATGSSLKWYSDIALTTLVFSGKPANLQTDLGINSAVAGTHQFYVTQTSTCESSSLTFPLITINPKPAADAGHSIVSGTKQCSGTAVTLGGSPTVTTPSTPPYTYAWSELTGTYASGGGGAITGVSNPQVIINNTTGSRQTYNFQVVVTDGNNCSATDTTKFYVYPQINLFLTQPGTTTFSTKASPQLLQVNIPTTNPVFTGIGVIQTAPNTYKFDPAQAYDNNQSLPQTFDIFFSGTDQNGCLENNGGLKIATMTLSNQVFDFVANQYCSGEAPYQAAPSGSGNLGNTATAIDLTINASVVTQVNNYVSSWNSTSRFYYASSWVAGGTYYKNDVVAYAGELYRLNGQLGPYSTIVAPSLDANWKAGALTIDFNTDKIVRNYYEGYYGGNSGNSTILKYSGKYWMFTNPNYNNAPNVTSVLPAIYTEFKDPQDIFSIYVSQYDPVYGYYTASQSYSDGQGGTITYPGSVVRWHGRIYQCIIFNAPYYGSGIAPDDPTWGSTYWTNITGQKYDQGYFYYDPTTGTNPWGNAGQAGVYYNLQFVNVNRNPVVSMSGLSDNQDICQADAQGAGVPYNLLSSVPSSGVFETSFNGGSTWLKDAGSGGAIVNAGVNVGQATFDSNISWSKVSTVASGNTWSGTTYSKYANVVYNGIFYTSLANSNTNNQPDISPGFWRANTLTVKIRLSYDPGTKGSDNVTPCSGISIINVFVHKTPTIAFQPITVKTYCNYDPAVTFKTVQSSGVLLSGYGVSDLGSGNGSLDPASAFSAAGGGSSGQNIVITALITDSYGCQNNATNNSISVNPPVPSSYSINTPSTPYNITKASPNQVISLCYNDNATTLTGTETTSWFDVIYQGTTSPANYTSSTGFFVSSSNKSFNNNLNFLPKTFFDDAVSKGANPLNTISFLIVYHSYDNVYCNNVISTVSFSVAPQLQVDITGISDQQLFCANGSAGTNGNSNVITLGFTPYQSTGTIFKINGANQSLSGNTFSYVMANQSLVQDIVFSYNVSSGGGNACQNPITKTIHVLPSPVASYSVIAHCDGDVIPYNATDGSGNSASNNPVYTWTFNDVPVKVDNNQNTTYKYSTVGNYSVHLDIAYAPVTMNSTTVSCVSNNDKVNFPNSCNAPDCADQLQVVGPIPTVDFTFSNVCEGDLTNFVSSQTNGVTDYNWDFGDLIVTGFGTGINSYSEGGTYKDPIHGYAPGTYNVTVTGRTASGNGACTNFKTRTVSILKFYNSLTIPIGPTQIYDMSDPQFQVAVAGDGAWVPEDQAGFSTWNFGSQGPTSSNLLPAWNNISYNTNDKSYVNSPCLDMSSYIKPAINLQYFMDARQQQDGAVLQYSTDVVGGVQQWVTLGNTQNSGLNWYTSQGVSGKPGDPFNPNFYGWSRPGDTIWYDARHSLDEIPAVKRNKVRFRVAFGSDGGSTNGHLGFAFTNVKIVERNRISLIENFTNTNLSNAAANDAAFQSVASTSSEIVKLEYHTGLPDADVENLVNPTDLNARAAFYGITNTASLLPNGYLDGASGGKFTSSSWSNDVVLRALKPSPLLLAINPSVSKVDVDITAVQAINSGKLQVFVAVLEKQVGTDQFVARKFFPNASGKTLTLPLAKGDMSTITIDPWTIPSNQITDISQAAVVAFVQDIKTKEVLQAAYLPNPSILPSVVTYVEPLNETSIKVYPNPADKELLVEMPESVKQATSLEVTDQLGRTHSVGLFNEGEKAKTIDTANLAEGMYILQVGDGSNAIRKKVIIIHK